MFQYPNHRGAREEEEQEIEHLFEKIMKKNFPNLAKKIDFRKVQEAQRDPKKLDPRRNTPRHITITLPKVYKYLICIRTKYNEYYSIIKKRETLPFTTTQQMLEVLMLR